MTEVSSSFSLYDHQIAKINLLTLKVQQLFCENDDYGLKILNSVKNVEKKLDEIRKLVVKKTDMRNVSLGLQRKMQKVELRVDKSLINLENVNLFEISSSNPSREESFQHDNPINSNEHYNSALSQKYDYTPCVPVPLKITNIKPVRMKLDLEYLTKEEYSQIPSYMGKITLTSINAFIDAINDAVFDKYNLLEKPKSNLKYKELVLYQEYMLQETEKIQGRPFVLEKDIAKIQNKTCFDKSNHRIITILRHFKKIVEIRSNGLVRYVLD